MLDQFRKCLSLIERKTAKQAVAVIGLVLLTVILEAFGIGLIFAFVKLLIEPSQIHQIEWIGRILGPAITNDETTLLTFLAFGLLATFIVKNIFLLAVYYLQAQFVTLNEAMMSARLFEIYLKGAYSLHLSRNSAEFMNTITGSVVTVFSTVVMGFINLASEFFLIMALISILLLAEPMLTIAAALIIGLSVAVFFVFSRSSFTRWGIQEQKTKRDIFQSLQQGFHSIKEVKVLGRQNFVLKSFEQPRFVMANVIAKVSVMTLAPRLWVESVIVICVLLTVIVILEEGSNSAEIVGVLVLFAAAAFRLIPSMNRIIIALNGIKKGTHAVGLVYDDMRLFGDHPDEARADNGKALTFNDTITVEELTFSYPEGDGAALKDIDLVLKKGESLGLVGPSGSGKSTFADIVLGLLSPTSGVVAVDGADISGAMRAWRRQMGYVPQSIYIIDDTLRRNVAFGLEDAEIDEDKLGKAICLAQLEQLIGDLPDGLETRLGERGVRLSGGQRQRVGIARALYRDPEVLILDEATSSLDSETEHEINNAIERLTGEKTLIIIAHRLSTVRKCQRLAYLSEGQLVDIGTFEELNAHNAEFRRLVELSQL